MSLCDELEVSTVFTDYDITCGLKNLQPSPIHNPLHRRKKKKTEAEIYAEFYEKLCKYSADIKRYRPHLFNYCRSYIFYTPSVEKEMLIYDQPYHFRRFILREGHDCISKLSYCVFDIIHGLMITGPCISSVTLGFDYFDFDEAAIEISLVKGDDEKWTLPAEINLLPLLYTVKSPPEYELISLFVQYRDDTVFPQSYEIEFFGLITRNWGEDCNDEDCV